MDFLAHFASPSASAAFASPTSYGAGALPGSGGPSGPGGLFGDKAGSKIVAYPLESDELGRLGKICV